MDEGILELAKVARRDGQEFDCATWLHKARSMPKDQVYARPTLRPAHPLHGLRMSKSENRRQAISPYTVLASTGPLYGTAGALDPEQRA